MRNQMTKQTTAAIHAALVAIAGERGTVTPEQVVESAKDEAHPLHGYFEWDDDEAAARYRLMQASQLIRQVRVSVVAADQRTMVVRAFVSLPSDRIGTGGYRTIEGVLAEQGQRAELLAMARAELAAFKRKYEVLHELTDVFGSIERVLEPVHD